MPIYEFRCLDCNRFFEVLVVSSAQDDPVTCPHCHQSHFERIMSTTSHQIRPSGGTGTPAVQNRTCSTGSCATITLPGPD